MKSHSLVQGFGLWFCPVLVALLDVCCVAEDTVPGPPYHILALDRVDPMTDSGPSVFALQPRTLETVTTFSRLESPAFRVREGGTLTSTMTGGGDVITSGRFEGGRDPDLRYVVEGGVAVPRDDSTLVMFSAAYQFEHVLPGLVAASAPDVEARFIARGPMDIVFGPRTLDVVGGAQKSRTSQTNAFFNPLGWQFGIERTSSLERVPVGVDGRIIAHELGHSVFQTVFFGEEDPPCDSRQAAAQASDPWFPGRLSKEVAMSGLNEGFADWMSFAVTGGDNPIQVLDLPVYGDVDQNTFRILTEDTFRWGQVFKEDDGVPAKVGCIGFYCIGTMFARSLVATYLAQGHAIADESARHDFSRGVVAALRGTAARMQSIGLPPPTSEVAHCKERDGVSAQLDPPVIGAFLQGFLSGLAPDQAAILCNELGNRFEDGFPAAFRVGCAP